MLRRALGEGGERGLAVIAGVFLASLVITTVLAYGVGLSQLFFEESLKSEPFDAKIEYARTPVENGTGWSNNTETMTGVCDELLTEFSTEFNDCTLVLGRQGIHSGASSISSSSWRNPLRCGPSWTMKIRTGPT